MWSSMNSNVALYKVFLFVVCLVGMNAVVFAQQTERSRVYEAKVMLSFENNLPPLLGTVQGVRFGMRGVVKLSGKKVSSGYYLFKNLILYFRNW